MSFLLPLLILLLGSWWLNANFTKIKGMIGGNQITKRLQTLDPKQYLLLNDVYIPKKDGTTAQIDHVVISERGIFVIEKNHYTGWIMGAENSENWTQIMNKRKEKFYNPIKQNAIHIRAVQEYLGDTARGVPLHSIVVFDNGARLKFKHTFTKAIVINGHELLSTIQHHCESIQLSKTKLKRIKKKLCAIYEKQTRYKQQYETIEDIAAPRRRTV